MPDWLFPGELAIAMYGEIPEGETWLQYAFTALYNVHQVWEDDHKTVQKSTYWPYRVGQRSGLS